MPKNKHWKQKDRTGLIPSPQDVNGKVNQTLSPSGKEYTLLVVWTSSLNSEWKKRTRQNICILTFLFSDHINRFLFPLKRSKILWPVHLLCFTFYIASTPNTVYCLFFSFSFFFCREIASFLLTLTSRTSGFPFLFMGFFIVWLLPWKAYDMFDIWLCTKLCSLPACFNSNNPFHCWANIITICKGIIKWSNRNVIFFSYGIIFITNKQLFFFFLFLNSSNST